MTALLLLHGFTGSPSSWHDVVSRLTPGRLVVPTAIAGHRGGPIADERTTWQGEVERLSRLVDEISARGERRVVLGGYSLGARLALAVALARPRRLAGLVLVAPHAGLATVDERASREAADETLACAIERDGIARFVDRWEALPLFATQRALPPDVQALHRARRLENDALGLAAALRALGKGRMPFLEPAASSLSVRTTLLAGALDGDAVTNAERLARVMPAATPLIVPGVGHDVCLERPEAVARAIEGLRDGAARERMEEAT
jgi:2-succinyl-6-hydroxy-2,4-cyclohexadiene-1-carboxylate synthase